MKENDVNEKDGKNGIVPMKMVNKIMLKELFDTIDIGNNGLIVNRK